jgi:L-phenylalanine/L-methionine N-acetyltransferase
MNIEIRRVEPGDYKAVQLIFAQPKTMRGTLQLPFPSEEMWKERLAKAPADHFGLVASVEGQSVGMLVLEPASPSLRRRHAGTFGMAVHDDWQSKGVGTALLKAAIDIADNWLNLSRLELAVYADNEPGLRLYKRFGFEIEGTHKKYAFRDGEFVDAIAMARVR